MIRITKFDSKKADELMKELEKKIKACVKNLKYLNEYTIQWFEMLKAKYGDKYTRRTEVRNFGAINVKAVVENNEKLYINRAEGFVGTTLKKDEFLFNCSDIDDIIVFHKDGKYKVMKVAEKLFVGTDILHIAIFTKGDDRTVYNVVYRDGKKGVYFMKRFNVTGVAKDKEYDLTQGKPGSRVVYFTANPNGEAEVIRVLHKPAPNIKKLEIIKDLSELAVKSRTARGNVLTKNDVKSITLKQKGHSTLGGRKVWFDADVLRVNYDEHGTYLGEFWDEDRILVITKEGEYYTTSFDLTAHFEDNIYIIEKWDPNKVWSLIQWNGEQNYYYGKRFRLEDANAKVQSLIGDDKSSRMTLLSDRSEALFKITFADDKKEPLELLMADFIDEKSPKAKGKRISTLEITKIEDITPEPEPEPEPEVEEVEPEPTPEQEVNQKAQEEPEKEETTSIDIDGVTMTIEKPKDTQLNLF
jgi:topoisomerase-4 subunit A